MFKLDLKSLKCIFEFRRGIIVIVCLRRYLVSADVTFLKNTPFAPDSIHTSQGEDDDLLVYTFASPAPASVPPLKKPPIT